MEYNIVSAMNTDKLVKLMEEFLLDGWRPYGELLYAGGWYVQAITRE